MSRPPNSGQCSAATGRGSQGRGRNGGSGDGFSIFNPPFLGYMQLWNGGTIELMPSALAIV